MLVHVRVCLHVECLWCILHASVFMVSSLCPCACVCALYVVVYVRGSVCVSTSLPVFPAVLGHGLWTGVHADGVRDWLHRLPSLAPRCTGSGLLQALTDHCTHHLPVNVSGIRICCRYNYIHIAFITFPVSNVTHTYIITCMAKYPTTVEVTKINIIVARLSLAYVTCMGKVKFCSPEP